MNHWLPVRIFPWLLIRRGLPLHHPRQLLAILFLRSLGRDVFYGKQLLIEFLGPLYLELVFLETPVMALYDLLITNVLLLYPESLFLLLYVTNPILLLLILLFIQFENLSDFNFISTLFLIISYSYVP